MPAPRPLYGWSQDGIALVAATAKTILEIATPATTGMVPVLWWVEFDGTSSTNTPVKVEVGRFSAGVTTATAITPYRINDGNRALPSQCTVKHSTSTEGAGTPTDVEIHRVPPSGGLPWPENLGMEWVMGASGFWRIRCTAAQAVNVTFGIRWTE